VGCGIDFGTGRAFFTKNGKFVGACFAPFCPSDPDGCVPGHRFKNLSSGLHPAIGLRTPREAIAVSFCGPFLFDIDGYVRKLRDEAWSVATRLREVAFAPRLCDQTSARRVPIDVDSVQAETAKDKKPDRIPKTSPLRGPEDKTTAAFVLDYLAHNGYDKALRLTKEEMTRRQWLNPRPPVIDTQSLLTHTRTDDDGNRTGTPSLSARLINLHSQVTNAHTTAIPWDLIDSLDPWRQYRPDSLSHRLEIQDFLRLLRQADDLPAPEAEVLDDEAIHRGKRLLGRSKEESWSAEDRKLLDQVFGLLGIPVSEWDSGPGSVAGEERRRADADELVAHIRRESGSGTGEGENVLMICRGERDESAVVAGTGDEASCARWEEVGGGGW